MYGQTESNVFIWLSFKLTSSPCIFTESGFRVHNEESNGEEAKTSVKLQEET